MTHDDAFLQDIVAHPDDDTPRLIYADWLDDHGKSERAELIRVQCELASLPDEDDRRWPLLARERALLVTHEEEWSHPLHEVLGDRPPPANWWARVREFFQQAAAAPRLYSGAFERGLLQIVTLNGSFLIPRADEYAGHHPLDVLMVPVDDWSAFASLLEYCEHLTHVRRLDLGAWAESGDIRIAIPRVAEHLPRLQHLRMDTPETDLCEALHRSRLLRRLQVLDLGADEGQICHRELTALLSRLDEIRLHTLRLSSGAIGPVGASYLRAAPALTRLRELDVVGNQLADSGAALLLASPFAGSLRKLYLGRNELSESTAQTIATMPQLELTHLDLSGNPVGDAGARRLSTALSLKKLSHLNLSGCELGANGLAALTRSSHLAGLRTLLLSSFVGRHENRLNRLGDFGAASLARTPCLTKLTRLELRHVEIGAEGVEALANSEAMSNLRVLDLIGNNIGDRGVRALVRSPYLDKLQQLRVDLSNSRIGAWARRAFRERFRDALL